MALSVLQYEEIVALLLRVPHLVDRLESREPGFIDRVHSWLRDAEGSLENNRAPGVSQVAACRAMLVEAARGVQPRDLVISGRPTRRKIHEATASLALQRGSDILHAVIAERQAAFQDAERISRQVLAVAQAKGILGADHDAGPRHAYLARLQQQIAADPDLASAHAHLQALVGTTDTLILFDRALGAM